MPVEHLPEWENIPRPDWDARAFDRSAMRQAMAAAIRSMVIWTVVSMGIVLPMVVWLEESFATGGKLLSEGGSYWQESCMPAVLMTLLGGVLGAFLGWRITQSSGLEGFGALAIGAVGLIILATAGGCLVWASMDGPGCTLAWASMGAMVIGGLAGLYIKT